MKAKKINEILDFQRGRDPKRAMDIGIYYKKWRDDHKGKILFTYLFYLLDSIGNKKTYWVHLYYSDSNESQKADTVYFDGEKLTEGWGTSGVSFSLSNMQNQPSEMFSKEEAIFWDNSEIFNKEIIDQLDNPRQAKKWFKEMTEIWLEMGFSDMMERWFNTGIYKVDHSELKFRG
jgi:hypothetical protein